jgi:hypothetical protein
MRKRLVILAMLLLLLSSCSEAGREPDAKLPQEEFEKLMKDFRSPSDDTYGESVSKLNKSPGQAIPFYTKIALEDSDAAMRRRAVIALGMTKDRRAVEPLIRAMKDREFVVVMLAARYLGKIGDERAVEPLIGNLRSQNVGVRQWSYNALKTVTGKDFGEDYAKWKAWYEKNKDK